MEHLASQEINDDFSYEVVLVDNNCTDQTVTIARHLWSELNTKAVLHVVTEVTPGLSHAREKGLNNSKGEIIVFCDDDNWLQNDYLKIAFDFMIDHPKVGALGGHSTGVLEMETPPSWWQQEATNYAVGKQALQSGDVTKRGYLWGAGIVIRKDILIRLHETGFRSLLSDRKGNELSSGGDSEICKWVLLSGYRLWYIDNLKFIHYITANRLKVDYLEKLLEGHFKSQPILNLYDRFISFAKSNKNINLSIPHDYRLFKKGIKSFLKKDEKWKEFIQLSLGSRVKFYPDLFIIIRTYKKLITFL